ncbi:DNA repair protein RecO [Natroniella sulfidigena]|uniref:DNA repair protein RecO n=1 Tax=Natroniella sulfidigena TaxID=723921 RepID=UPI00200AA96B|nr:DNA repair protein RecO [Natroniella sulfidigena]MCK8815936.1 DNA repair protein RecO [Natroniella sulfidigena]
MSLFTTDAIVLRDYELGEADKIVLLFSKTKGKIKVVANGARKTKSTLAAGMQPFIYNQIIAYQGKSELAKLSQCDIKENFRTLCDDLFKMAYASYIVELIIKLTVDREENQLVFSLLLLTLRLLDQFDEPDLIVKAFELKLLKILGYRPHLKDCIKCNSKLTQGLKFDALAGGVVCADCASYTSKNISLGTVKFMEQLLKLDYKKLFRLRMTAQIDQELLIIIPHYIQTLIDSKLETVAFLRSLRDLS